jgi:ribosome-binding protein aMBF1 (putative translation factor)
VVKYSSTVAFPVHGNPGDIGDQSTQAWHAAGLSQEELAHRADIDRTYISSIERQQYAASIEVVDSLAKGLGVEASELLQRRQRQTAK